MDKQAKEKAYEAGCVDAFNGLKPEDVMSRKVKNSAIGQAYLKGLNDAQAVSKVLQRPKLEKY